MSAWRPSRRDGLTPMAANTARIVAIELLAAAQGVDLRRPLDDVAEARRGDGDHPRRRAASGTATARSRRISRRCGSRVERGDFVAFAPDLEGDSHAS